MTYSPIFGTGLARSGGALYSMCLSTHPQMMVACCPNLELFRSYRNALIRERGAPSMAAAVPPAAALQDYHGTEERLAVLDLLLAADLEVGFADGEWPSFHEISVARGDLEGADLTRHYDRLKGSTYKAVFRNLLEVIADARNARDKRWVGLHEAWAIDAYPALARSFPDARFLIMLRDPRAVVHSMLGVERIDPSQVAQVLSYVRHWRKYVALAFQLARSPLFQDRLHVTAHDLILIHPRETVTGICRAFGLDLDERMLDTRNYIDYTSGTTWKGNSSFEENAAGISAHRATRWQQRLAAPLLDLIEYLAGPDLQLAGYPVFTEFARPETAPDATIIEGLLADLAGYANWRSDLGDPLADLGLEAVRRQLLTLPSPSADTSLVRRCFLFSEVYQALRDGSPRLLPRSTAPASERTDV